MDKKCSMCGSYFDAQRSDSVRCPRCQAIYNKNRRNELTKAKYQNNLSVPSLPVGYVYLNEWAEVHRQTRKKAVKLVSLMPHIYGAIKVRNPHGGVNVWAVPKDTAWPDEDTC